MINGEPYIPDQIAEEEPSMHQSAAVSVMDARTGLVIYENNQHEFMYPASITKIMTALLVIEEVENLQEDLVFSEHAVLSLPVYASRMHMAPGDVISVYEALYGLMLPSGNEVANALAEHVSGSVEAFVAQMNRRAAELGARNTRFINPCGLPGYNQHTTAYDMALIMREAINHPVFNRIISTPSFFVAPTESHPYGLPMQNTNLMIWHGEFYNPLIVGGKTGFTNAARHTLVSYAREDDIGLIVSVLYAPRTATFTDTTALLDYVLSLPQVTIFEGANYSWSVPVIQEVDNEAIDLGAVTVGVNNGVNDGVNNRVNENNIRIPAPPDMPDIRRELVIPDTLAPPVRRGDQVGYKNFYAGDTLIYQIELVSMNTILPQMIMPTIHPEPSPVLNFTFLPFFAFISVITIILMGTLSIMVRRHRRVMRRRRRKMARVRYARYGDARYGGVE